MYFLFGANISLQNASFISSSEDDERRTQDYFKLVTSEPDHQNKTGGEKIRV